jgi:lincosamide nucleotidyltransferase A/C/D/E
MAATDLVAILERLDAAGVDAWLDGGWGVDALLGEQTRPHDDVDLVVSLADVPRLVDALEVDGFEVVHGQLHSNFVLHDASGLQVDVHPARFDEASNGIYRMENGEDWTYPARGFAGRGRVLDRAVRCLTPDVQVLCHAGYELDESDRHDLRSLRDRFGVELPA